MMHEAIAADRRFPVDLIGLWQAFWYAILPDRCAGCQVLLSRNLVPCFCDPCWSRIRPLTAPFCPRCGHPFTSPLALAHSPSHLCGRCRSNKPAYHRAQALYPYESPLREAIHLFKYRHNLPMGIELGRLLARALPHDLDVDLVMPVPLSSARLREREYNQSLVLADAAAAILRVPLDYTLLQRRPGGPPQTSLPRRARLRNLRRAFVVEHPARIRGKRVLLIDDVFTTGTTVNECAKTLRRAGSDKIVVITLARSMS